MALMFVGVMMTGFIGLTVYMEWDRLQRSPAVSAAARDAKATQLIPLGLQQADLPEPDGRGAQLMGMYCVQCHALPNPHMHTPSEWVAVLARMDQHMANHGGGMIVRVLRPSDADAQTLEAYLQAHALKPLDDMQRYDLAHEPGSVYKAVCTECHALPDPTQHTASDWRRVVARMKVNMMQAGRPIPEEGRLNAVLTFLQQAAAP